MAKTLYNHQDIELKWRKKWLDEKLYTPDIKKAKNPFYNLMMFPYPSAEGLHAGNMFAFTGSDVFGRFKRMNGYDVLETIGLDGFGIHSENFAIKVGRTPQEHARVSEENYYKQLKEIGNSFDWTRTVETYNPNYYKWTQWLFLKMFESGLAYRKNAKVNWCPSCKTVLADEQVMTPKQAEKQAKDKDGNIVEGDDHQVCERCGTIVERKDLEQWYFRITDYADRLLDGLQKIEWTQKVKLAQKNWIGKKEGINISYKIKNTDRLITCFTTRPDTNFGATFIVISPEFAQNILELIPAEYQNEAVDYIKKSLSKSEQQRLEDGRKKTGAFTGLVALNNLNGNELPIYIADFVLSGVGTGAVVGVPGHDKRDFEFAKEFGLPIKRVVKVGEDVSEISSIEQVQESDGEMINSEFLDGLHIHEATIKMMDHLENKGWGERVTSYHLRDWLISRQRYWGPPIPMVYCEKCARENKGYLSESKDDKLLHVDQSDWNSHGWWPLVESELPVVLPEINDFKPSGTGSGPLANHPEFYEVTCPSCGSKARRETDVIDTFVDSSWYFLRYPTVGSESDDTIAFAEEITKKWLPVDQYFGGAEHSVLHLMYSRFVTKVFYDLGMLDFDEPFPKFYAHGLMIKDGAKMSKSRGNVVNPDDYIDKFGADSLRTYLMFMGPMDSYPDFRDSGMEGMHRFLNRVWSLVTQPRSQKMLLSSEELSELQSITHKTIKKVTEDISDFKYNTSIAAIMEFVNFLRGLNIKNAGTNSKIENDGFKQYEASLKVLLQLLAPFAPHMTEELWYEVFSQKTSIHFSSWPEFSEELTKESRITLPIQVNGKLRHTLELEVVEATNEELVLKKALSDESVTKWISENEIKKHIFVPGKLLNLVG